MMKVKFRLVDSIGINLIEQKSLKPWVYFQHSGIPLIFGILVRFFNSRRQHGNHNEPAKTFTSAKLALFIAKLNRSMVTFRSKFRKEVNTWRVSSRFFQLIFGEFGDFVFSFYR